MRDVSCSFLSCYLVCGGGGYWVHLAMVQPVCRNIAIWWCLVVHSGKKSPGVKLITAPCLPLTLKIGGKLIRSTLTTIELNRPTQ